MERTIQVEAARIPDRDRLLKSLTDEGHDARPVDEVGIAVHYTTGKTALGNEVFRHVEEVVMDLGAPFVPTKHEGVIYLRPGAG